MAIGKAKKIGKFIEDDKHVDGGKFIPADIVNFRWNLIIFYR